MRSPGVQENAEVGELQPPEGFEGTGGSGVREDIPERDSKNKT